MPLSLAVPDDYAGATDDIKVRAALSDTSQNTIAFQRNYTLADATTITLRSKLNLLGPGKQCGCGITRNASGSPLFRADGTGSEVFGIVLRGLDIWGSNTASTNDRMFYGTNLKQSQIENCLIRDWTGTAFYVDGSQSNDNLSRDNRIAGGSNANASECGIYHVQGNMARSTGDYVSGYATLIRATATQVVIDAPTLESGGDAVYVDGGTCTVRDGWFDPSTLTRTVVQAASVPVFPKRNRGVYSSNVHVVDSSKWFPEYNPA